MKLLHKDGCSSDHDEMHPHIHTHEHTHTHDGVEHTHVHAHTHEHCCAEHTHSESELHSTDKEMQTLAALLSHWVEHNVSHAEGFTEWAGKAEAGGRADVAADINDAVKYLLLANDCLNKAKGKM